jgi:hypothetical protein
MQHRTYKSFRMFDRDTAKAELKLPPHVVVWIEDHEEDLWTIYIDLKEKLYHSPWIMDKANFTTFCACAARLSSIDSPMGRMGRIGRRVLVHDFKAV